MALIHDQLMDYLLQLQMKRAETNLTRREFECLVDLVDSESIGTWEELNEYLPPDLWGPPK